MKEVSTKLLLRYLLRPAVRFCLRHALLIQDLVEMAKTVFVEESLRELEASKQPVNVSRLSASSGLQRRDVERIYRRSDIKSEPQGLLNKIVGQWQWDQRFTNSRGKACGLSFDGESSEFYSLARSVSNDLNPATLLFELERRGLARRDGDKLLLQSDVCLISSAHGSDFIEEGFSLLSDDLVDLSLAVEENLQRSTAKNLHARTTFDNIPMSHEKTIRAWLLKEGSLFHRRIREFLSQYDRDFAASTESRLASEGPKEADSIRVAVGAYGLITNNESYMDEDYEHE